MSLSPFLMLCFRVSRGEVRYAMFVPLSLYIPSPNNDSRGHEKERKPVMNDVSGLRIEHTQAAKFHSVMDFSIEQCNGVNRNYSPYESRVGGIMTIRSQQRLFDKLDEVKNQA